MSLNKRSNLRKNAALQCAAPMAKQKPQAALWHFVAQSRGHKALWQNQKKRQLFQRIVVGSTSAKICPAVALGCVLARKKRPGSGTDLLTGYVQLALLRNLQTQGLAGWGINNIAPLWC